MSTSQFSRSQQGKIKLSQALLLPPTMNYFHRVLESEFPEIMDSFFRLPDVSVIMVGPSACSRVLYFRAEKKGLANRLRIYPVSSVDFAVGRHMEQLEQLVEHVVREDRPRAIVINVSCIDTLAANDFDSIIRKMKEKHDVLVQIYHRGPLIRNRENSQSRFADLFVQLIPKNLGGCRKKQINIFSGGQALAEDSPLFCLLEKAYTRDNIKEFSKLATSSQLADMANSEFNVLVGGFGFGIAAQMQKHWGIPFQALPTCYHPDEIVQVTRLFTERLQIDWSFAEDDSKLQYLAGKAAQRLQNCKVAVGVGGRSFELAWLLRCFGIKVNAIILDSLLFRYPMMTIPGYIMPKELHYGEQLLNGGDDPTIYLTTNITHAMRRDELVPIDVAIGSRAAAYCSNARKVVPRQGYQFGYGAIIEILEGLQ